MADTNIESGISKRSPLKVVTADIQISDENLSPSRTSGKEAESKDLFFFPEGQAPASSSETSDVVVSQDKSESHFNSNEGQYRSDAGQNLSSFRVTKTKISGQSELPSPPMFNKSLSDSSPQTSTSNSKETNMSSVLPKMRARGEGLVVKRHQRPLSSASLYNHQSFTSLPRSNVRRNTTNSKLSVFDTPDSTDASPRNSFFHSSVPPQMPSSRMFNVPHPDSDYCTLTHVKTESHQHQRQRVKTKTKVASPLVGTKDDFHCSAPFSVNAPNFTDAQNVSSGSKIKIVNSSCNNCSMKVSHSIKHSNNSQRKPYNNHNQFMFYKGAPQLLASAYQNTCDACDVFDSDNFHRRHHDEVMKCSKVGSSRRPLSLTSNCAKCGTKRPTSNDDDDRELIMLDEDKDLRPNSMIDLGLHAAVGQPRYMSTATSAAHYHQILTKCDETETESDTERGGFDDCSSLSEVNHTNKFGLKQHKMDHLEQNNHHDHSHVLTDSGLGGCEFNNPSLPSSKSSSDYNKTHHSNSVQESETHRRRRLSSDLYDNDVIRGSSLPNDVSEQTIASSSTFVMNHGALQSSGEWDDTGATSSPEPVETTTKSKNTNNRFDQVYHFELSEATEITWGTADMQFGLQVMKEQVINKNYYYDFRVTTQHGSQLDYSSPDTVFDFVTTNFPLVEVKFFETELRRVFSTIIIPDAPLSNGAYGKVALEIWFCWLGRHPVVGKSQIFWHMLRYTKSKDWHNDKSYIKKVGKFVKNTSMIDFLRNKEIKLENCRQRFNFERLQAERMEEKLVKLHFAVDFAIKQYALQRRTERFIVKSIGEEIRNFCTVAKFRNPSNNVCCDSFLNAGQKISTCEERMRGEFGRSAQKMRVQLTTILSAYRKLLKLLSSKTVKNVVKTMEASTTNEGKNSQQSNQSAITCYTVLAELNYIQFYEIDLVFTPAFQLLKDLQFCFEEIADDLACAMENITFEQ